MSLGPVPSEYALRGETGRVADGAAIMLERPRPLPVSPRFFVVLYALAFSLLCLLGIAFGELGHIARIEEPTGLDQSIHAWVVAHRVRWPILTLIFRWATLFGDPEVATVATVSITIGLFYLHRQGLAGVRQAEPFVWLGALLGGRFLSILLKLAYQRERPPLVNRLVSESTYSFPSGHSVFAAVFFVMLAFVLARMIPASRVWQRVIAVLLCVLFALVVAASRVWLGVHYPTDVLGGLLLGFSWALTVWLIRNGWDYWRLRPGIAGGA